MSQNLKRRYHQHQSKRVQRFSIRKCSFGAASVAVFTGMVFTGMSSVSAQDVSPQPTAETTSAAAPTDSATQQDPAADTTNTGAPTDTVGQPAPSVSPDAAQPAGGQATAPAASTPAPQDPAASTGAPQADPSQTAPAQPQPVDPTVQQDPSVLPGLNPIYTTDVVVSGTGLAGSLVTVTLPNGTSTTVPVGDNDTWQLSLAGPLAKDQTVTVKQTEPGKQISTDVSETVKEKARTSETYTPNLPKLVKVDDTAKLTAAEKEAVEKAILDANRDNQALPGGTTITVDEDGKVTLTYQDQSIDVIEAYQTVAPKERSVAPTVAPIDSDDNTITGTGVPSSTIAVTLPNGKTETTTVKPDSTWVLSIGQPLPAGTLVTVTQTEVDKKPRAIQAQPVTATAAEQIVLVDPELTVVENVAQLTETEKEAVIAAIKAKNADKLNRSTMVVAETGQATITHADQSVVTFTPDKTVVVRETTAAPKLNPITTNDVVITGTGVPGAAVTITLPNQAPVTVPVFTNGEFRISLAAPLLEGQQVTATQTEWGKKESLPQTQTVAKTITQNYTPNLPKVVKVDNTSQLTPKEKVAVEKAIREANQDANALPDGTVIDVADNGKATLTYQDQSIDTIEPHQTVIQKEKSSTPTVSPIDSDDTTLTGTGVPSSTIEVVLPNGTTETTTVQPDSTWVLSIGQPLATGEVVTVTQTEVDKLSRTIKSQQVTATAAEQIVLVDPELTVVENVTQLTATEKEIVIAAVKAKNPDKLNRSIITVSDNGTVTITYADQSVVTFTPDKTVVARQTTPTPSTPEPEKLNPGESTPQTEGTQSGEATQSGQTNDTNVTAKGESTQSMKPKQELPQTGESQNAFSAGASLAILSGMLFVARNKRKGHE